MARRVTPEDELITAITAKQPGIRLERVMGSIQKVFRKALDKEPRLLAYISTYETSYMRNSIIQMMYDYDLTITYQDDAPSNINDVIVDTGTWDVRSLYLAGMPKTAKVITKNPERIGKDLDQSMPKLIAEYEGIMGFHSGTMEFKGLSDQFVLDIGFDYIVPMHVLRQYQGKAVFEAKNIWRNILGRSVVPDFVKPFLAFSWISQECTYDQRAYNEVESDAARIPSDPVPHLAYGPLCEHRGICSGFAWAFRTLMEQQNIECLTVTGFLKEDKSTRHAWCMVKIDGQYYHVDPTWGSKDEGVFVDGCMIPDQQLRATHEWDEKEYPQARGMRFDYDYIEEYLADNGTEYIDDGANEKYFWPDIIID